MGISGTQPALMEARLGIARLGATRLGYFYPIPIVVIASVNRSTSVLIESIEILDRMNSDPNECHFTVKPGLQVVEGQHVTISVGSDQASLRYFAGIVTKTTQRNEDNFIFTEVVCSDYAFFLDRRLATASFMNMSATDIVRSLMFSFTSQIAYDYVQAGLPIVSQFSCINERMTSVLARLANQISANEVIAAYRLDGSPDDGTLQLHFFLSETDQTAPSITNATMPTYVYANSFQIDRDLTQVRTRETVEGKSTTCLIGTPGSTSDADGETTHVDYLVIAGGGGGSNTLGGGGGAGGILTGTDDIAIGSYAVVIGAGGAAQTNGSDSSFNAHTAVGGGAAGPGAVAGSPGGSGGGGTQGLGGGAGTAGQGNNGGAGNFALSAAGGGGGGTGGVGRDAGANVGGNGGPGITSFISGASVAYGGGGGGNGASISGTGGVGGGGNGGAGGNPGSAGAANTGGGGGGGGSYVGGSGVVILSYPTGLLSASGGTMTAAAGRTIHTFTSGGTFAVSAVTPSGPLTPVVDIPIEDASQLEATGGVVRIGTQILSYLRTAGPVVDAGQNPPGSSLSGDAAAFATTLSVHDSTVFTESAGWVKVGDQIVRYDSKSTGILSGIPSVGFGALVADVKADTTVTWLGSLVLSNTGIYLSPPIDASTEVVQRVTVDDYIGQAALASIEGGDGIHEEVVSNDQLSVNGCIELANADLLGYSKAISTIRYTTRDTKTTSGRSVPVKLTGNAGSLSGLFTIQEVRIYGFDQCTDYDAGSVLGFPPRDVTAARLKIKSVLNLIANDLATTS